MVRIPLELKVTTAFAEACYGDTKMCTGQAYCSYADDLAKTTDKLWRRHFRNTDFIAPQWRDAMEYCEHASRMFALMSRFGRTYEEINDVTNVSVADLVSAISYDPRLPLPKRDLDLRTRVAEGGISAQMIVLADITLTSTYQSDWVKVLVADVRTQREQLEEAVRVVSGQTTVMRALLGSLHAIPRRGPVRRWAQEVDGFLGGVESYLKKALRTRPHLATAKSYDPKDPPRKRVPTCPPPTMTPKISSGSCLPNTRKVS